MLVLKEGLSFGRRYKKSLALGNGDVVCELRR